MPSRRTKRFPAQRGRGIQLSASTRHAKRASGCEHPPGLSPPDSGCGTECSKAVRQWSRSLAAATWSEVQQTANGRSQAIHRRQSADECEEPRTGANSVRSLPPVRALCGVCFGSTCRVINVSAKRGRRLRRSRAAVPLPVSRLSCAGNGVKWSLRGRSPGARNGAEWTCQLRSSSQAPMRRPVP